MSQADTIFQCLICGRISPVTAAPPKCGACGSGNGVTRPARDAAASVQEQMEEDKKK